MTKVKRNLQTLNLLSEHLDRELIQRSKSRMQFLLIFSSLILCVSGIHSERLAANPHIAILPGSVQYSVIVYDGKANAPIELARVSLFRGKTFVSGKVTDQTGRALLRDIMPDEYRLVVHSVGFDDFTMTVHITTEHILDSVSLVESTSGDVIVEGARAPVVNSVDPRTGNQVFESETYHAPPTARITELLQQNLMGAVRAPTGEVHIRGAHGEFSFYVDGAPIPLGVFGGLNEVVDPKVIDRATFLTGGFPAEYGGQISAVVDIQNHVPVGPFHADFSTYGESYLPKGSKDSLFPQNRFLNANGEALSISDHFGKLGIFLSGSRQETDRRIDPPVASIFHDHGFDYFLYGKADYLISDHDYLTVNLNYGVTSTQVPFDSLEVGALQDDLQRTTNQFQTLTYYHSISTESDRESNLMIVGYAREGGLRYTPGLSDVPAFKFASDSVHAYSIAEDRSFATVGVRTTYDNRLCHEFKYSAGLNFSLTNGTENFTSTDSAGRSGPATLTDFKGSDFGLFAQTEWHPMEWTSIDVGLRFDQHVAPDIPTESQLSPRVRWNFLLGDADNAYLYFGRLFMPNNIEGLRSLASNINPDNVGTLAERDNLYEAVYTHSFDFGLRTKLAYFKKDATPGVDDQTVGSSAVKTPVNIANVHVSGIEVGLYYSPADNPFSGYVNASLIHAYGSGALTGGFLPIHSDGTATDLDHDQRLSVVASLNYQPTDWFANLSATYGSGLTNGNASNAPYDPNLFAFNQASHVTPSWIMNLGLGYTIHLSGGTTVSPSLFVKNLLDDEHLLKGAYFSGASWEEPRSVTLKVAVHI